MDVVLLEAEQVALRHVSSALYGNLVPQTYSSRQYSDASGQPAIPPKKRALYTHGRMSPPSLDL
jgi:hypothetical protein